MGAATHRLIPRNSQGRVSLEVENASNSPTLSKLMAKIRSCGSVRVHQEAVRRTFRIIALECSRKNTRGVASRRYLWYAFTSWKIAVLPAQTSLKSEEDIMTNMNSLIRQPSAFLPVALSLVALALVLGHVALFGVIHEADEGAAAHIWQILMVVQVPIIAFFAFKYLPQKPKQALRVLSLQIVAALAACAPVFFLKL